MSRVTVRDVLGARRRGAGPGTPGVPAGPTTAAPAPAPDPPAPPRIGTSLEVAADTLRQLLGVDHVLVMRIFGSTLAALATSPRTNHRYGKEIAAADEPGHGGTPDLLTLAVEQIAAEGGAFGSAGAGMYAPDGALIGIVVAVSEDRLPWEHPVHAKTLAHHAEVLGTLLAQEIHEVAAGRAEDARAVGTLLDDVTKMPDRRAWELLVRQEEDRASALGHPAAVLAVDAGPAGSARALRKVAGVLRGIAGGAPALCRLDDRLWGVLVTGLTPGELGDLAACIAEGLREVGATPAIGVAARDGSRDLAGAWSLAGERMLLGRRTGRPVVAG
jgi:hypothetical protein